MNKCVFSSSMTMVILQGVLLAFAAAQSTLGQLGETETSRAEAPQNPVNDEQSSELSAGSIKEIAGQWHAQFDTAIGVQTYHFNFQVKDGELTARAIAEIGGQKRDVKFIEARLHGNRLSFVEVLQFRDREIRIEFTGTLGDKRIVFVRKVGNFVGEETEATRDAPQSPPAPQPAPAIDVTIDRVIKDAFQDSFRIGMAGDLPARYSEQELSTASEHFNAITPENCMKPERVHPEENTWQFERPDGLMQWAADNNMSVHGHTLVWHQQTRDWFFRDGDRKVVTQRMKDHIHTLVGRYKGKIHSWDVVNEAINDGGNEGTGETENLRNSKWLQILGPEYLALAFQFAHEADPNAVLYYNDYGIESGPKHASSMVLLRRLLEDGAPVHAVGIQGHWTTARVSFEDIDKAIADYASLGLKVAITELDVTIRGASGGQFGSGFGRRRFNVTPPSAEDLSAQAEAYAKLFAIFEKHKDVIVRVTFWGLNDRRTWRFGQHPLLLDANNNPKSAYAAIVNDDKAVQPSVKQDPDRGSTQRIDRSGSSSADAVLERYGKRNISVHDPSSIVRCGDEYWMFSTGTLVKAWRSKDLKDWREGPRVFAEMPQWVTAVVPDQRGHFWAPDVIQWDDRYLLYYSVSSFGKNTSAIAMVSNATLDPDDDNYRWIDHGVVIQTSQKDNFNAIDPAVIKTSSGELWMAFGSYWSGIKLIRLDEETGLRSSDDTHVHALAWNEDIEAARLFEHNGWYYLFLNWGKCCRGVRSTYNIRVGRSQKITGPYLDRDGKQLLQRGGTLLLGTDGPFIGPGHANVFCHDDEFVFHCHFYDATNRGRSRLAIMNLTWGSDGWPALQGQPAINVPQGFIVGADISWVQAAEDRGVKYSENGVEQNILKILKKHGFNYIRLRVFHDPTKPTPKDRPYSMQGYCDLPHTIEMAKRVKAAGMGLLIDFHYSDCWADPGKQFTPSAWADLSFEELVAEVQRWTVESIGKMKDAGVQPDMVQIGNEISPGIMTDRGGSVRDWHKLGQLLKAGIAGVKDVDPKILVVLHIDKSGEKEAARWWVDNALAQNVEFDILGLSCYERWHGPPSGWKATFEGLAARYPKLSFLIVEIAREITATNQIMHELPNGKGLGTFIWEPTANNNGQALFDRRGAVIPDRMRLYDQVVENYASQQR